MQLNFISDTVTKPSAAMRQAMMDAAVGDDTFKQDPTVIQLEKYVSDLLGMEAAIFCPSGTMTNQVAIKCHTQPGDELITSQLAHVYNYEGGGVAFHSGVTCRFIDSGGGLFTAEQLESVLSDKTFYHAPKQSLVVLENTTNKGGGQIWDMDEIKRIRTVCLQHDLKMHLDGARLFNALVETGESPKQYGEQFDSISICLSKGLGAPVGSVLAGSKEFIDKAYRIRKILGGNMRQSGMLAAAGLYALQNNIPKLKQNHMLAKRLAQLLSNVPGITIPQPTRTNILIFNMQDPIQAKSFWQHFANHQIDFLQLDRHTFRITTHLDIPVDAASYFEEVLCSI